MVMGKLVVSDSAQRPMLARDASGNRIVNVLLPVPQPQGHENVHPEIQNFISCLHSVSTFRFLLPPPPSPHPNVTHFPQYN